MTDDAFDTERLLHECASAFHNAQTQAKLDADWAALVRPAYGKISKSAMFILDQLYELNSTHIQRGLR